MIAAPAAARDERGLVDDGAACGVDENRRRRQLPPVWS
jgi:hypothetical protein